MKNKIDYIETPSRDLQKTKIFFSTLFAWKFQDFGSDYTAYDDGRMKGGFFKSGTVASTSSGSTLAVIYSDDLESAKEKAVELGASIVKDIFSFPGGRRFHFSEPGGSEFAIWSDK